MNIWLVFVPGSGASIVEMLLRTTTDLSCLPVTSDWESSNTAHGFDKQWHPTSKQQLFAEQYTQADDNIFTPIVPMPDMSGQAVLKYIDTKPGLKVYIGPNTDMCAEFALISMHKVSTFFENIMPTEHSYMWSDKNLEIWEQREYLSLSLMQWWLPQMRTQWQTALSLGYHCINTMDLFKDLWKTYSDLCTRLDINITQSTGAYNHCKRWSALQNKIWLDWENFVKYKQGLPATITGGVVQESIIQYHLREQGIELKCYGLNTFPNSEELKQYYD